MSRFFGIQLLPSEIVKVIKLCPILSRSKILVSFRHDLVVHGLAQMRIGTKSFLGLSFKQVGYSPLEGFVFCQHLSLGCEVRLLRHPALPLVHQLLLVRTS